MSQPGDSITLTVGRQTAAGAASTGKVVGDFTVHINGSSAALSNFVDVGTAGAWRVYQFDVTLPSSAQHNHFLIQAASGDDVITPDVIFGEIETQDLSSLGALFLTSEGAVVAQDFSDSDLGDVVEGDSWDTGTIIIPAAKLSRLGLSDLTGASISAAFMDEPGGTRVDTESTGAVMTASIDDASAREVSVGWTTWPTSMDLGAAEREKVWYLDIQIKGPGGEIITGYRGQLRVLWERDVTT